MKILAPLFMALLMVQAGSVLADDKEGKMDGMKHPAMTKEMREKMAVNHEKMAACLRSDKDVMECHGEMQKTCGESMGAECPMMKGMMHKGMMKGKKKSMQMDE